MRIMGVGTFLLLSWLGVVLSACAEPGGDGGETVVIGGVYADDVEIFGLLEWWGVKLAIEEINASGVFDRTLEAINLSPSQGDFVSPELAARNARTLFDEMGAIALVGGVGADPGRAIIEVTNTDEYSRFVHCNSHMTEPEVNLPGMAGADETDSFYRTNVSHAYHLELGTKIIYENQWKRIGLIRLDSDFGSSMSLYTQLKIAEYASEGFELVFDEQVPYDSFDVELNKETLDRVIAASTLEGIDITILFVLAPQTPGIIKYLTEHGYQGRLLPAMAHSDIFDIATGLNDWIGGDNSLLAIESDNFSGENSALFRQNFLERFDQEPDSFSPNAYDCAYALAFSLLYGRSRGYVPEAVKENMPRFKEDNLPADAVEVNLGAGEFARAAGIIEGGQAVHFNGASGDLLFDQNGDRPRQGLIVLGPNSNANDWEVTERYDADLNRIE